MFVKYQHIERFGTDEVEGIDIGVCFVMAKIDGTNSSIWYKDGQLYAGSRNRELTLENDNAGFYQFVLNNKDRFIPFFEKYPNHRLFGEFLIPHSLKTYREDAWKKFWIFDIFHDELEEYTPYEIYSERCEQFQLDYIPALCKINNPTIEQLHKIVESNTFLIKDGEGSGEGIVIKNFDYKNKYGRITWAKIVRNEFKELNRKSFGTPEIDGKIQIENIIAEKYITRAFIEKTKAKIEQIILNEGKAVEKQYLIPRLLGTCFHELISEEIWNIVKENKNPTIDFKKLNRYVIYWVKQKMPELF